MPRTDVQRRIEAERGKPLRTVLVQVLRATGGNVSATARELRVNPSTVRNWMKRFEVHVERAVRAVDPAREAA